MSNGMIHVQPSFREFACDVNKSQVSTFYIFLSYHRRQRKKQWWKTVRHYGNYHHVYLIPLKQFCLECSDRSKVQNLPSVDHRCQNASEKHIPSVDPTFSLWQTWSWMYQVSSHTNLVLFIKTPGFFLFLFVYLLWKKKWHFIRSCASPISMAAQFAFALQIFLCKMLSDEWSG